MTVTDAAGAADAVTAPKGLYVLNATAFRDVYGAAEQADVARLIDVLAPPQTAETIRHAPELLAEVEVLLSGWGAPVMDAAFLASAPRLRAVFYGAGMAPARSAVSRPTPSGSAVSASPAPRR